MKADRRGQVLLSSLMALLLLGGCATSGTVGASSPSPAQGPPPASAQAPRAAVGVGVGTRGVGIGGTISPSTTDPVAHSTMMGFVIGSVGGPIGALVGAGLGYLHGLSAKKELERQIQLEVDKQKKLDQEIERQILAQRAGAAQPASPAAPEQGVTIVKDHLREEANRPGVSAVSGGSEPGVVTVTDHLARPEPAGASGPAPSPVTPGAPAPTQGPMLARVPPEGVDGEGFRAIYEGGRLVRRIRDLNGDGKPDVIVHYDGDGQVVRREESSQLDGRIDTWTYYARGEVERKESDTDGDGTVDLWAHYSPQGDLLRLESLVDRRRRLTQLYADGKVVREEWRREPGGQLQARLTYQDGTVREKEEDSAGNGRLDLVSFFDDAGRLVKQGRRDQDGRILAWRYFDPHGTLLREEEIGKGGEVVAVSHYENGKLARRELYELDGQLFKRVPLVSEGLPASGG